MNSYEIDPQTRRIVNWIFYILFGAMALFWVVHIYDAHSGSDTSSYSYTTPYSQPEQFSNPSSQNSQPEQIGDPSLPDLYPVQDQIKCLEWNQEYQNDSWPVMDCTP